MNVWKLVVQEIRHRKWNFVLGLLSVTVAVACLVGSMTLLDADEIRTREILEAKQAAHEQALEAKRQEVAEAVAAREQEVAKTLQAKEAEVAKLIAETEARVVKAGKELQDAARKITKEMGFNILILPSDQDLNELYTQGTLSKTMPESYVTKLSNSKIMTVNHLLPMLTHRLDWDGPAKKQTILVVGTRGEVPLLHRDPKKPLQGGQKVAAGTIVLGYEVLKQQKLKKGDKVKLLGREFTVSKSYPQRGTSDDATVWINLAEAQELLKKQNLINAVMALECNCSTIDRVAEIRNDIAKILPGTQVLESGSRKALARAETRNKAKEFAIKSRDNAKKEGAAQLAKEKAAAKKLLDAERAAGAAAIQREKEAGEADLKREEENRESLQSQRTSFASILVPLVIAGCAIWIGFLAFANARQRSSEIGILRAIGLQSGQILFVFLSKALLIGVIGSVIGYAVGFGIGLSWSDLPATSATGSQLFVPGLLLLALAMSPILSAVASWFPATLAARQDPAVVLQGD